MPRMTRAALRTGIHEDVDAAEVPLPATPQRTAAAQTQRTPLGEITLNHQEEPPLIQLEVNLKPAKKGKKGKGQSKKVNKARKGNNAAVDEKIDEDKENTPEVAEDDNRSTTSSATEEACANLLKDQCEDPFLDPKLDTHTSTPPSKAVRAARRQLSPKSETPRFNPELHRAPEVEMDDAVAEDSFVASIETRSPAKILSSESAMTFDAISSPSKATRIEDVIEVLDENEEALDLMGESLPFVEDAMVDGETVSPVSATRSTKSAAIKAKALANAAKKPVTRTTKPVATKRPSPEVQKKAPIKRSPVKPTTVAAKTSPRTVSKPLTPRLATTSKSSPPLPKLAVAKRTTSKAAPSTATIKSTKAPTKAMTLPLRHKPRVSSITKVPFIPAKSTKAPTRSTFTLPGEAVSAKLKTQREERQKRDEETSAAAASTISRKPAAPGSETGAVGSIVSSKLRGAKIGPGGTVRVAKAPRATVLEKRFSSVSSMEVNVGGGSPGATKATPTVRTTLTPRLAAATAPRPMKRGSTTARKPNTSAPRASILPSSGAFAKPNGAGREAFGRERKELDAAIMSKKDKEEAAKKARAEAAERGRTASREWAEKMRVKKMAAAAAASKMGEAKEGEVRVETVAAVEATS